MHMRYASDGRRRVHPVLAAVSKESQRCGGGREAGGSGREDGQSQPSGAPLGGPPAAPPLPPPPPRAAEPAGLAEAAAAGAADDEMMADVAALAGGGSGGDTLAALEGALRPVERYAVRLVEEARARARPLPAACPLTVAACPKQACLSCIRSGRVTML